MGRLGRLVATSLSIVALNTSSPKEALASETPAPDLTALCSQFGTEAKSELSITTPPENLNFAAVAQRIAYDGNPENNDPLENFAASYMEGLIPRGIVKNPPAERTDRENAGWLMDSFKRALTQLPKDQKVVDPQKCGRALETALNFTFKETKKNILIVLKISSQNAIQRYFQKNPSAKQEMDFSFKDLTKGGNTDITTLTWEEIFVLREQAGIKASVVATMGGADEGAMHFANLAKHLEGIIDMGLAIALQ